MNDDMENSSVTSEDILDMVSKLKKTYSSGNAIRDVKKSDYRVQQYDDTKQIKGEPNWYKKSDIEERWRKAQAVAEGKEKFKEGYVTNVMGYSPRKRRSKSRSRSCRSTKKSRRRCRSRCKSKRSKKSRSRCRSKCRSKRRSKCRSKRRRSRKSKSPKRKSKK
jgi:hypothetical protein